MHPGEGSASRGSALGVSALTGGLDPGGLPPGDISIQRVCMGGSASKGGGLGPPFPLTLPCNGIPQDMVNKEVVRILLECILVMRINVSLSKISTNLHE